MHFCNGVFMFLEVKNIIIFAVFESLKNITCMFFEETKIIQDIRNKNDIVCEVS